MVVDLSASRKDKRLYGQSSDVQLQQINLITWLWVNQQHVAQLLYWVDTNTFTAVGATFILQ